jgi:ubiquinone/menaquinone biosynthesis C-methylase UbiE
MIPHRVLESHKNASAIALMWKHREGTMSAYYGDVDDHYLQRAAEVLHQPKQRSYQLMHLQPGSKVLDVGCGPGTDTIALAQLVGPTGQVVGIDFNPTFVAQADDRAVQAGVRTWVTHHHADATNLPFEANSFDACQSERLLQHLHHPEQAVAEMVRSTRSGGWIVLIDADWGMLSIDTPEVDIERRLARFNAEAHNNGYAGRQLYRLLKRQQLTNMVIEMVPVYFTDYPLAEKAIGPAEIAQDALLQGVITEEEARRWRASLAQADAEGVFFASIPGVLIAGRKP